MSTIGTQAVTVSEYASKLGRALRAVGPAVIEGEVQKIHVTSRGMIFFDLTDGDAVLACKVFAGQVRGLEHSPREGDLVQVQVDRPDLWAQRGSLSLIVSQVRLAGEGELRRRRQELIERLTAEGLCDETRRRRLPRFPRAIGVIAGEASDGMSDVIRALVDRWPAVHIIACASLVQGKAAPSQLIDAVARLQQLPLVDVIVMARGGGSVQDLACFDDERLCRALSACTVPVVCAIGHTDNNPVCNHVAWPAFTPSRSAELVVPAAADLRRDIASAHERLDSVPGRVELAAERLDRTRARLDYGASLKARAGFVFDRGSDVQKALGRFLATHDHGLALLERDGALLSERARRRLDDARRDIRHAAALTSARDFRRRGWLLANTEDGAPVHSVADLSIGQRIDLRLHDGRAQTVVETINPQEERSSS